MATSTEGVVEEALKAVDAQVQQLPDVLLALCRKTTAIASNSGFPLAHAEEETETEEAAVASLALRVAREIEETLGSQQTEKETLLTELAEAVLFGASKEKAAAGECEAEVTAVSPQPRKKRQKETAAAAAAAVSLAEPDVVFVNCPLTQEPFKAPVSQRWSSLETACCHVFEEEAILQHMREGSIPCPFAGCKKRVKKAALRRDVETEEHMRRLRLKVAEEAHRRDTAVAAEAAAAGVGCSG